MAAPEVLKNNLFVANLGLDVTDEIFESAFAKYGEIKSAKVMLDIHTGISRGFGFVMFAEESSAMKAMEELQNVALGSRGSRVTISVAKTSGKSAIAQTTKLYVRNVPRGVDEAAFRTMLDQYGTVLRYVVKEDTAQRTEAGPGSPPNSNLVVVFLEYAAVNEANACVRALHNTKPWANMVVPLMAKTAETAEMRNIRKMRQSSRTTNPGNGVAAPNQSPAGVGTLPQQAINPGMFSTSPPKSIPLGGGLGSPGSIQSLTPPKVLAVNGNVSLPGLQGQQPVLIQQLNPGQQPPGQPAAQLLPNPPGPPVWPTSPSQSFSSSWGPQQLNASLGFDRSLELPNQPQRQQVYVVPASYVVPQQYLQSGPKNTQPQCVIAQPNNQMPPQYCLVPNATVPRDAPSLEASLDAGSMSPHLVSPTEAQRQAAAAAANLVPLVAPSQVPPQESPQRPSSPLLPLEQHQPQSM